MDGIDEALEAELDQAMADYNSAEQHLIEMYLKILATRKRGAQVALMRKTGRSREYFRLLKKEHGLPETVVPAVPPRH